MTTRERIVFQELREEVVRQLGHGQPEDWTQKHFAGLSDEIREKTGQYLSSHTLRRVFGRLPQPSDKEYLPQLATLDILCAYVGGEPWLKRIKENSAPQPGDESPVFRPPLPKRGVRLSGMRGYLLAAGLLLLLLGFWGERALYRPRLLGLETAGTAPFRVLYRVEAPYIGYHSVEVRMTQTQAFGPTQEIRKPIRSSGDPATLLYSQPGLYKAILLVDGKKTDSLSSCIYSPSWTGFFQQGNRHFPSRTRLLPDSGLAMDFLPGKMPDTSGMYHTYFTRYDSTGVDPEDFTAEAWFLCNANTGGQPWYNVRFKVFGSRHNLEVEVIDDHNRNNYLEIRHYFGEVSRSGLSSDQLACQVDMARPVYLRIRNRGRRATVWINGRQVLQETYTEPLGEICGLGMKAKGRAILGHTQLKDARGKTRLGSP